MKKSFFFLVLILLMVILAGCSTGAKTIKGEDENAFSPVFRLSQSFMPLEEKVKSFGFEVSASHGAGKSSQQIAAADYIRLDRTDFFGPDSVDHKFDISTLSAAIKWGFWIKEIVGIEWLGGVGLTNMNLEIASAGQTVDEDFHHRSLFAGLQVSVKPLSYLGLYGRSSAAFYNNFDLSSVELGVSLSPVSNFSIFGGWRWWEYTYDRGYDSSIRLEISGPMAGLLISF